MGSLHILLLTSFLLWATYVLDLLSKRRKYKIFSLARNCRLPTAQSTNIFHKLRLVSERYNNIFEDYYATKFAKYGITHAIIDPINRPVVIHTIDPRNLRTVLVDSRQDWLVFKGRRNALKPLAQDGVLTTDGALWHRNRVFLHRHLNNPRAKDTAFLQHDVDLLFIAIGCCAGDNNAGSINMSTLIQRMTLDMSSQYLFGMSTDFQLNVINKGGISCSSSSAWRLIMESYVDDWNIVRDYVTRRSALGSKYWLIDGLEYRYACARFCKFADKIIEKAEQDAIIASSDAVTSSIPLISELISEVTDLDKVREFVLELIIAGQNMTGASLEWVFAELAAHPDIYARLRTEILQKCGSEALPNCLTWNILHSCQILQHVIKETLRCHPVVASMSRTAARDTVLPRGGGDTGDQPIAVPKGATLTSNIYLLHRRKELWGEDAHQWNPDRWIERKIGPEYVPFSAGPRICLGRQISLTQLSYVIARFVQRFDRIEPAKGSDNLAYQYRSILSPKYGVNVLLSRAIA